MRLQGSYSGTTGREYAPDANALRPSSFAFGHSPWSRPSLVTDTYVKASYPNPNPNPGRDPDLNPSPNPNQDVKLWAKALDAAQVAAGRGVHL